MRNERTFVIRGILAINILIFSINDAVIAQAIDTGLFTQNGLRQCNSATACIGGDPTLQRQSDFDLSVTGLVTTLVSDVGLGAEAATSIGFNGAALTPALSAYAYTTGPQRFTLASFGFQRYEFLAAGQVTIAATLSYSQSGETVPQENNPRGILVGSVMRFQMDADVFIPDNCNVFSSVSAPNAAGFLITCLIRNGEELFPGGTIIDFVGLQNFQASEFDVPTAPVTNGVATAELTISGQAGDVFFLGASIGAFVHLGGFANSLNTLLIDIDQPALLNPTFAQETFVPAPVTDSDGDGDPDFSDPDDDNDGINDGSDNCRVVANLDQADLDGDSVGDSCDNCTTVANLNQIDVDSDGHGNRCDADFDNSCQINFQDLSIMANGFFGSDPAFDLDGSGIVNFADLNIMADLFFQQPGPSPAGSLCNP